MAKHSKKAGEKVGKAIHEMHEGALNAGKSEKKVTNKKQAITIGLSQARDNGAKVPEQTSSKKEGVTKTTSKSKLIITNWFKI